MPAKLIEAADVTEYETFNFSAFASDLGLKAGEWPERIETTLGNKQPWIRLSKRVSELDPTELLYVTYFQQFGCIRLRIYND